MIHTDIELNTAQEVKKFILSANERKGRLCGNHKTSQWVIDNWDKIADECFIDHKAKNILRLLELDYIKGSEEFSCASGIAYQTGNQIDYNTEKSEGWGWFHPINFKENDLIEIKRDSLLGISILKGKILKTNDDRWAMIPKGSRTKGYYLTGYDKVRKA